MLAARAEHVHVTCIFDQSPRRTAKVMVDASRSVDKADRSIPHVHLGRRQGRREPSGDCGG
jgi:hypothetical protein